MKKEKITRQELYQLVWSHPISDLTKKLEITDHNLRKICKQIEYAISVAEFAVPKKDNERVSNLLLIYKVLNSYAKKD